MSPPDRQSPSRAPSSPSAAPATAALGVEIGAVSLKWARRDALGEPSHQVLPHGGDPRGELQRLFAAHSPEQPVRVVVTGQAAASLLALPSRSTTECLERALSAHGAAPDMLVSLGGETFRAYPMKDGTIRNVLSTSKCAAGTGEFIVQQLQRMGMSLDEGLAEARSGQRVSLATRCSVHCKSDATHMLNKGECTPGDIAASLIADLAERAATLVGSADWPTRRIVLSGGVADNQLFVEHLSRLLDGSEVQVLPQSACLEAYGAQLLAEQLPDGEARRLDETCFAPVGQTLQTLAPLTKAEPLLDYRVPAERSAAALRDGATYTLGLDAGSTTTKAVLLDVTDGSVGASCYLRTLGNPVDATRRCLDRLIEQIHGRAIRIAALATTGSGREMVSVYLDNCLSINEIVAHARAAAHYLPEVDTVFEIGGQDSKFISFADGVPVDYAMNDGCSAGTGSFLEESASLDMGIDMAEISATAEASAQPIAFGERCAAFINTDLRNALQQGAAQEDVVAGLVYAIADNYISRVVGPRQIGDHLLLLGGVALNRSVGLAMAARTGRQVLVPPRPELMGCIGAALEARDRLSEGDADPGDHHLAELAQGEIEVTGTFRCKACDNNCELKKISVGKRIYPFGGLCPRYEMARRGRGGEPEGRDLIAFRNQLMFTEWGPRAVESPRGVMGIPLALTTFELLPLYAALAYELGYEVLLSELMPGGAIRTAAAMCFPCQLAERAVQSLLDRGADFVLLPRVIELEVPEGALHGYTCPTTTVIPDVITAAHPTARERILAPHVGLSAELAGTTLLELERLAPTLGLEVAFVRQAAERALEHYRAFQQDYRERARQELEEIAGEPTVVVAGRPYTVCSAEVNLALPRKIAARGFHVVPADMLPARGTSRPRRDVWHHTQQISDAVAHVNADPEAHLCLVSCFSCGPDSVMVHDFRRELAGSVFCYLEIDSHTAHAGFETRVGAFLDIIEERKRRALAARPAARAFTPARLAEPPDHIIDSDGGRVEFGDPRVVHVLTDVANRFAGPLVAAVYEHAGRRCRIAEPASSDTMDLARRVCSGRECVPLMATAGAAVHDLTTARSAEEITLYLTLDQEGPCQNGAWPLVWDAFVRRRQARNVIGAVGRSSANKQLGIDGIHVALINRCILLGDLLEEAAGALECLAQDRADAMERFGRAFGRMVDQLRDGSASLEDGLAGWAQAVATIPLREPLEQAPKILIFGGLNVSFVQSPVRQYFIEQGVVPKVVDVAEGITSVASEASIRSGLKHGHVDPGEQLSFSPPRDQREEFMRARMARFGVSQIESQVGKLRAAMAESGLLFDELIPFVDILKAGNRHVSTSSFTETGVTVGRYACSVQRGLFDGLVNLGCFNCQPAMNAQAIIRPLASDARVPYVAIDCEGPWLSANQLQVLETVAVQAKRVRASKNGSSVAPDG